VRLSPSFVCLWDGSVCHCGQYWLLPALRALHRRRGTDEPANCHCLFVLFDDQISSNVRWSLLWFWRKQENLLTICWKLRPFNYWHCKLQISSLGLSLLSLFGHQLIWVTLFSWEVKWTFPYQPDIEIAFFMPLSRNTGTQWDLEWNYSCWDFRQICWPILCPATRVLVFKEVMAESRSFR